MPQEQLAILSMRQSETCTSMSYQKTSQLFLKTKIASVSNLSG